MLILSAVEADPPSAPRAYRRSRAGQRASAAGQQIRPVSVSGLNVAPKKFTHDRIYDFSDASSPVFLFLVVRLPRERRGISRERARCARASEP
jgi:hypothetical protein